MKTQERIAWVQHAISSFFNLKPQGIISKKKLIAECALKHGCTPRIAREILNILRDASFIVMEGDDITKWAPKKL